MNNTEFALPLPSDMDIKNIKTEWNATILDILKAFIRICDEYGMMP